MQARSLRSGLEPGSAGPCPSLDPDGDSTGKQFEAYAQLLPRVSLEEVAMDF